MFYTENGENQMDHRIPDGFLWILWICRRIKGCARILRQLPVSGGAAGKLERKNS